jgi:hypothetical protein
MIGELVGCNTTSISEDRKPPAGRSIRISSFFKKTGSTEDRFDPAFRGRLGVPNSLTMSRQARVTIMEDKETQEAEVRDPTPRALPGRSCHRQNRVQLFQKCGQSQTPRPTQDILNSWDYAQNPKYSTSSAEYGRVHTVRQVTRAGLSSYVGSICKESTLEKVFH